MRRARLGGVRQHPRQALHDGYSVADLGGGPDLEKLAEAYGMRYLKLDREDETEHVVRTFLERDVPVLLEVEVDPDEQA